MVALAELDRGRAVALVLNLDVATNLKKDVVSRKSSSILIYLHCYRDLYTVSAASAIASTLLW